MEFIKKIIEFLKKIGILKIQGSASTFKSSRDPGYKPPDPFDN